MEVIVLKIADAKMLLTVLTEVHLEVTCIIVHGGKCPSRVFKAWKEETKCSCHSNPVSIFDTHGIKKNIQFDNIW